MRSFIIKLLTFLAGLFYFLEFILPAKIGRYNNPLTPYIQPVGEFLIVFWGFSIGVGALSLMVSHYRKIKLKRPGWAYSIVFFISMIAMMIAVYLNSTHPTPKARFMYELLFTHMYMPLGATIFSLLALFMASAAYRGMKIRTLEGAVMVLSAIIVMLGQVPIGLWLTHKLPAKAQLPRISAWILNVANTAAYRAVIFGIAVGAIAMAIRVWLSLEKEMEVK